MGFNIV